MSTEARKRTDRSARAETVVCAALALVDSGGLESLTMRRLATSLGIQLPTIYRLFDGKQALLNEMAETILGRVLDRVRSDGGLDDADWTRRITRIARALRETLLEQRDGARIVGGSYTSKQPTLTLADTMLASLRAAGFPSGTLIWAMSTIFSFVLGEVLEQQGAHGAEADLITASVSDGAYPCLAATQVGRFLDFDARFDFGLRILLAGLTTELPGT
jgi:TetR/AcrR family tetracycline transcriptional repressor